jgi:hypothetical protein
MHLEYEGGTFEKPCYFQSNHAFIIKLNMTIPFKKLIWANRLTESSYKKHMQKLDLRPAEWIPTKDLWKGRHIDPAYRNTRLRRNICINSITPPSDTYPTPDITPPKRFALPATQHPTNVQSRHGHHEGESQRRSVDSFRPQYSYQYVFSMNTIILYSNRLSQSSSENRSGRHDRRRSRTRSTEGRRRYHSPRGRSPSPPRHDRAYDRSVDTLEYVFFSYN